MKRFAAVCFAALALLAAIAALPAPAIAERDIMHCMERCLRAEGRDARDTCKMRCADVPSATRPDVRPPGQGDCMARYKACQRHCGQDRACHQRCKNALMGCR